MVGRGAAGLWGDWLEEILTDTPVVLSTAQPLLPGLAMGGVWCVSTSGDCRGASTCDECPLLVHSHFWPRCPHCAWGACSLAHLSQPCAWRPLVLAEVKAGAERLLEKEEGREGL